VETRMAEWKAMIDRERVEWAAKRKAGTAEEKK
jgi:hypothetical protein